MDWRRQALFTGSKDEHGIKLNSTPYIVDGLTGANDRARVPAVSGKQLGILTITCSLEGKTTLVAA